MQTRDNVDKNLKIKLRNENPFSVITINNFGIKI